MIAVALITLLFLTDFKLAMIVGFTIGAYGLIFYFTKSFLNRLGKESLKNNQLRFTAVSEAFGAAKEVKVAGLEQNYIERFSNPAQIFARHQATVSVLAQIPRYFLEIIAFGGVMLMMLYLIKKTGSFNNSIPIISLYVFAGYRLMPAIQQIYTSVNSISYIGPSLNSLYDDLKTLKQIDEQQDAKNISLNKSIILKNVIMIIQMHHAQH